MPVTRRNLIARAGLAVGAAAAASACGGEALAPESPAWRLRAGPGDWGAVRRLFRLDRRRVHMSAMLISSHPEPVRAAIQAHRQALDADPVVYLERNNNRLTKATMDAAGRYLGVDGADVALTDSTTMGVGLVYGALRLRAGQEILTTDQDYYVTHEAIRLACRRTGAVARRISLYDDIAFVGEDEIVDRIARAIGPRTRVLGLTWVHSSTGVKLPMRRICEAVDAANRGRGEADRVLVVVDGVHGFGNQDTTLSDLGCDILAAGCHKWLFGPRGTGVVAATRRGWAALDPAIPSFVDDAPFDAWISGRDGPERIDGQTFTPGGFKPFEHQWALAQAFELHEELGKDRVQARTEELAGRLKAGLARTPGVRLRTPRAPALSAGIVAFDVDGLDPQGVVNRLRERNVVASVAPYRTRHVRLTPSIRNTPEEVDVAVAEVARLTA